MEDALAIALGDTEHVVKTAKRHGINVQPVFHDKQPRDARGRLVTGSVYGGHPVGAPRRM